MKRTLRFPMAFVALIVASLFALTAGNMQVAAQVGDFVGSTYFRGVPNGNVEFIPENHNGTNSILGSVLPNYGTRDTSIGGGAIGTNALGISAAGNGIGESSDQSNQRVRKQALYCFLQKKNGVSEASRHVTCTGLWPSSTTDWERMGSAGIVHQMLKKPWGSGGLTITPSEWVDLYNRLVENDTVRMERLGAPRRNNTSGVFVQNNGSGSYNIYDMARYNYVNSWDVDSWVFTENGSQIYALQIICANPLGRLDGLDPYTPPIPTENYNLDPSVQNVPSSVEPGGEITVDGIVENTGADISPGNEWRLTQIVYGPSANPSRTGDDSASDPCDYFDGAGRIPPPCAQVDGGTGVRFDPARETVVRDNFTYTVPETAEVGTKICFAVSVRPPSNLGDQSLWRHSTLHCIVVSKSPKIQVWGGDVRAGGRIHTSTRNYTSPGLTHGSWVEYAALSVQQNIGFASGAGLNNGNPGSGQSSWSGLTFANTGTASGCTFGCYNFTLSSGTLVNQFITRTSTPSIDNNAVLNLSDLALPEGGVILRQAENVTLTGTTIPRGNTIVIVASGTVTIDGNIIYEDIPYTNIRDIPQVIIRAPTINIRNSATQVDAWLLATAIDSDGDGDIDNEDAPGILNTCSDVAIDANLSANICNNRLMINGPVVADAVYLRRTAGSGSLEAERGEPAEVFNLRADAYLWANAYGSGTGRAQTVHTKELSPRF